MNIDRARGALLGLAVGDALGTTFEFEHLEQPAYPALATGPATDVVGGGPFDLVAGQVTDDTQLAVCLARTLVAHRGVDADDLARRYVAWSRHAFDIGSQTGAAIGRLDAGEPARAAGLAVWRASERRPAGNGSLMRTAPIGVALAGRGVEEIAAAAIADSLITHADPRCLLACAAFDAAIAAAVTTDGADGAALVAAARTGVAAGYAQLRAAWSAPEDLAHLEAAVEAVAADLSAAGDAVPRVYTPGIHIHRTAGFVRVAFRLAFWHAVHTPSWRAAVVDIASRGGDADTNTAIAGALLGARDGEAAIPAAWIERVLAIHQPGPAAWAEEHHPRHLLAVLAR